ncbi:FUCTC-like protein [Mya arenaria]|uniref:Fucosyltransferase n=1 Tax=Mya arenaria TaxID=6604 RepID=A0ABY7FJP6_MYAAR|nr:FUCTC-like protein [Mya arenaria]
MSGPVTKCSKRSCINDLLDVKIRYNTSARREERNSTKKSILWYKDRATNIIHTTQMFTKCEYSNCVATDAVSEVNHVDAVILTVSYSKIGQKPPFKRGNPDQAWIFKLGESPYGRDFSGDYITEKFLMNYNHDWILVARGGADYRKVIPTQTYVNSAEFESPAKLVGYLNDLANDKDRYVKLLKEKDKYEAQYGAGWPYFLCELCHRLNHLSEYRHSYPDIAEHLQKDRCFKPRDNKD